METRRSFWLVLISSLVLIAGCSSNEEEDPNPNPPGGGGPLGITAPADVQQEATGPTTAVALGQPILAGGEAPLSSANDAPAVFPLGTTTVTWTVTDGTGAQAQDTQSVTVNDTTAPTVTAPADVTADENGNPTMVNLGTPSVSDLVDANPTVSNDAPAAGFPVGTTTVTWTATDASGNAATATQQVTINGAAVLCSTHETEFRTLVYPVLDKPGICMGCHTPPNSVTTANGFNILANDTTGFELFRIISAIQTGGQSVVLVKPLGGAGHGGGNRFPAQGANDPDYLTIKALVDKLAVCTPDPTPAAQGVVLGTGYEQLYKITLSLAGRVPTNTEVAAVEAATDQAGIDAALDAIMDGLLNEEIFYTRLKEIYNDLLLTDDDADSTGDPSNNFDLREFANEEFFDNSENAIQLSANYGFARAPVELVDYVVRNNRPFTEILTADYTLVNPYSADVYGVNAGDPNFPFSSDNNPANHDVDDFRRVNSLTQANGRQVPLAGVLSTHAFLARYPSTNTNVNRARARYVFYYFLGVDIEGLAPRDGLDLDNVIGDVPTFEDPQCKVCHDVMDPVAGLLKNRANGGRYQGDVTWHNERFTNGVQRMLDPGYTMDPADALPTAEEATALQWLAMRLAQDDRFAEQTVRTLFDAITGVEVTDPSTTSFLIQARDRFIAGNYDLKALLKEIHLSPYLLARNLGGAEDPNNFVDIGAGRMLTPAELERKVTAVAGGGYQWSGPNSNSGLSGRHNLLYGGIDSGDIIVRTTDPNSLINGIQRRIANQVSCERVAADLINGGSSTLFPIASLTDMPGDTAAEDRIRRNIQFLHKHLLGEDLAIDDPEIVATYQLFQDVRAEGVTAIPSACRGGGASTDDNGTVIPWMAVVTYLLSDYEFYYE